MPIFRSLDLERMLIYQKICFMKSAIFHSIKLPFDVQAAEKILYVIYYSACDLIRLLFNNQSQPVFFAKLLFYFSCPAEENEMEIQDNSISPQCRDRACIFP